MKIGSAYRVNVNHLNIFPQLSIKTSCYSQNDPHLDGFLCDVFVDFCGRILVEAV